MSEDLEVPETAGGLALRKLVEQAKTYAVASRAASTMRAYLWQWKVFELWCASHACKALPAESQTLVIYLTECANSKSVPWMAQALAAIAYVHRQANEMPPTKAPAVLTVWEGICRTFGVAPKKQAQPLSPKDLLSMSRALGGGMQGTRDRALLLLGFAGARRRSEIVALDVADVTEDPDGLLVLVRRSKTDQTGVGFKLGVPYGSDKLTCPVRSMKEWLTLSGIVEGAIFQGIKHERLTGKRLHPGEVARIVQRTAKLAGVPTERLSGHSLRSGLATTAAKAGKSLHTIAKQTGHKSLSMVERYIREAEMFDDNAASGIGL